jgi:hypothetical protein
LTTKYFTIGARRLASDGAPPADRGSWRTPQVPTVLDRLKDVPVDIEPRFVTADRL